MKSKSQTGKSVFVMMSGGVDSSVAALLLRDAGYQVTGVFMKNWSPNSIQSLTDCPWEQDQKDAATVANQLNIPFRSVNFEPEYRRAVIDYFFAAYRAGETPNPDIICNEEIKFGAFYRWARKRGADLVASGHYARIAEYQPSSAKASEDKGKKLVARGKDPKKDQSYFLSRVDPTILDHVLFPLGELTKEETRRLARKNGLIVAAKKDSQGICFVGQIDVGRLLRDELGTKPGPVLLPDGTVIGQHDGAFLYTIGQRRTEIDYRLAADVRAKYKIKPGSRPPFYVVARDVSKNTITVSPDKKTDLETNRFEVKDWRWFMEPSDSAKPKNDQKLKVQIRYQSPAVPGELSPKDSSGQFFLIKTKKPLLALASGQFAVLYINDIIVGSGVIV